MPPSSPTPLEMNDWLIDTGRSLLGLPPEQAKAACVSVWQRSLLDRQRQLRFRARHRFPDPDMWLWTERSLSQASDWWSAQYKASLFPLDSAVVDACCGAGVDSVALAQRTTVMSIDSDPLMTSLAASNAAAHGLCVATRTAEVTADSFRSLAGDTGWLHIDPDRRLSNRRTRRADEFSPALETVLEFASLFLGTIVKLAPSTQWSEQMLQHVEQHTHRLWIGNRGECKQQLLLTGDLKRGNGRTAVLAERPARPEFDRLSASAASTQVQRYTATPIESTPCVFEPATYVFDLHTVLHAAGLQLAWADEHQLKPLGDMHGYFTSDSLPVDSPWAQAFVVREVLPWDDRKVRRWLRSVNAGEVVVKNRLVQLDANAYQRRYSMAGGRKVCLLVTQLGERVRAIAVERL